MKVVFVDETEVGSAGKEKQASALLPEATSVCPLNLPPTLS